MITVGGGDLRCWKELSGSCILYSGDIERSCTQQLHIEEADASGRDSRIGHKSEDGKGALTAEVYAFEIDVHGWRVWDWRCVAEDEPVDQITGFVPHIKFRGKLREW